MRKIFRQMAAFGGRWHFALQLSRWSRGEPARSRIVRAAGPKLFCDLTQSWSEVGGGVRTYLLHKRRHILESTPHSHLMIIPGARDDVVEEERAITVTVASPHVPGSPHYRLMLRNGEVRAALERFRPDLIECQDAYNLPWAAIAHRKRLSRNGADRRLHDRLSDRLCRAAASRSFSAGPIAGAAAAGSAMLIAERCTAGSTPSSRSARMAARPSFARWESRRWTSCPLGVELGEFGPIGAIRGFAAKLGLADDQPLLIYVGRLDGEKKPDVVVDAFRQLPSRLGAKLVLLGEGPLRRKSPSSATSASSCRAM